MGRVPGYYRFGDFGLVRIADGEVERLSEKPVWDVWDDYLGGVIFTTSPDGLQMHHLTAEATESFPIERASGYAYPRFTGVLNGFPSLFFAGIPEGADLGDWPCAEWSLNSRNLITGSERLHLCLPVEGGDLDVVSVGGQLFVGAPSVYVGSTGTSTGIRFWDSGGDPLNQDHNPFPDTCEPCELTGMISPDGRLLAYRHRADSKWPPAQWDDVPTEEWWEQSSLIPAEIIVMNLINGDVEWQLEVPANQQLTDFDGRYVVVESSQPSGDRASATVHDTWTLNAPIQVDASVILMRDAFEPLPIQLRHDGLGVVSFGESAERVMSLLTELLGPPDWTEVQIDADVDLSVQWSKPLLYLQFTYWDYFDAAPAPPEPMPAGPVFHYYQSESAAFATQEGITVGSTVGALTGVYPGVRFDQECGGDQSQFIVDSPMKWPPWAIFGLLDGEPDDTSTRIVYVGAGWDRTPC